MGLQSAFGSLSICCEVVQPVRQPRQLPEPRFWQLHAGAAAHEGLLALPLQVVLPLQALPLQMAQLQASGCAHSICARLPSLLAPERLLLLLLQVAKLQASIQELQDAHQREEEACAEAQQVAEEALQLKRDLEARHVPFVPIKVPSAGGGLRCCCGRRLGGRMLG